MLNVDGIRADRGLALNTSSWRNASWLCAIVLFLACLSSVQLRGQTADTENRPAVEVASEAESQLTGQRAEQDEAPDEQLDETPDETDETYSNVNAPEAFDDLKATEAIKEEGVTRFPGMNELDNGDVPIVVGFAWDGTHSRSVYVALARIAILVAVICIWLRAIYCISCVTQNENLWHSRPGTVLTIGLAAIAIGFLLPAPVPATLILIAGCLGPFALSVRAFRKNATEKPPSLWEILNHRVQFQPAPEVIPGIEISPGVWIGGSGANITLIGKSALLDSEQNHSRIASQSVGMQTALALIDSAIASRATDLHVNYRAGKVNLRKRVDGTLSTIGEVDSNVGLSTINILKVMAGLDIADRRRSQDGSFRAQVDDRRLSFRVSSQGTQGGETLSIRILDPATTFANLDSVGMPDEIKQKFSAQLSRNHGLILIAGNTGAGKSTTACAAMQTIAESDRYLVSIEDPIEYDIPSVDQIEVNHRIGRNFETGLRGLLRMDADVILVGEIRDKVSAEIACQAAMSGQLVIATIHSGSTAGAVARLVDLGVDLHNVASCLRAVLAQTLVRKLCVQCRAAYTPDASTIEQLGGEGCDDPIYSGTASIVDPCSNCDGRGFLRRTGIFELMEIDSGLRNAISQRVPTSELQSTAIAGGMDTLWEQGTRLVRQGTVSMDELHRVLDSP